MDMFDDVKLFFRCEQMLEYAKGYKKRSQDDSRYYMPYLTQMKLYRDLKSGIKTDSIKLILSELEKKVM